VLGGRVGIDGEVAQPLELKPGAGRGAAEAQLNLRVRHDLHRGGVEERREVPTVRIVARVRTRQQSIVEAGCGIGLLRRSASASSTLCRGDGGREGVTAAGGRSCCLSSREHKGRAWGPSCGGRRMTERAAHLVDAVLPWVPVRQWVLTVPYRLRYQMAWNHGLSRAVLRVYTHSAHQRPRPEARLENFTIVVVVCHARLLWSVLRIHLVPPMNSVTAAATGSGCSTITKCPARGISTTCTRSPS
jgi:hypothetical protein